MEEIQLQDPAVEKYSFEEVMKPSDLKLVTSTLKEDDLNQDSMKKAAAVKTRPEAVLWGRGGSEMKDPLDIDDIEEIEMVDDFNIHQNDMIHQLNPPMAP